MKYDDDSGGASAVTLQASCSDTHDCSARLQAALASCRAHRVASCEVVLEPPGALFRMEQAGAVTADGVQGLAIRGNGARLLLNGDAPFLNARRCVGLSFSNLTLAATRPPFTYRIVVPSAAPGLVNVSVDMRRYLLAGPGAPASSSSAAVVQLVSTQHTRGRSVARRRLARRRLRLRRLAREPRAFDGALGGADLVLDLQIGELPLRRFDRPMHLAVWRDGRPAPTPRGKVIGTG